MGGGDLNSKKSWHPNTIKNQERVWKAEKAAAVEKQRIVELQRERAEEHDRSELNDLAKQTAGVSSDNRLSWMYNKPDKKGHQEDYLLGKTIDSNFHEKKEEDAIPAVSRRVVGSSMISGASDTQVDLVRKMREDPLLLVKERERAARAALLNNPLQRKKLTELLRKEQEQRKERKTPKEKKHKDLDDKLAAKINALGDNGLDLAALLASGDSSTDSSSSDEKSKKKKHKKEKKSKKKKNEKKSKHQNDNEQDSSDEDHRIQDHIHKNERKRKEPSKVDSAIYKGRDHQTYLAEKKRLPESDRISNHNSQCYTDRGQRSTYRRGQSPDDESDEERMSKLPKRSQKSPIDDRRDNTRRRKNDEGDSRKPSQATGRDCSPSYLKSESSSRYRRSPPHERRDSKKPKGLSAAEREERLAEMSRAGAQHELERSVRVAKQRAAGQAEEAAARRPRLAVDARTLPASLESRIHSNRHNIQRNERHMNEHFARR